MSVSSANGMTGSQQGSRVLVSTPRLISKREGETLLEAVERVVREGDLGRPSRDHRRIRDRYQLSVYVLEQAYRACGDDANFRVVLAEVLQSRTGSKGFIRADLLAKAIQALQTSGNEERQKLGNALQYLQELNTMPTMEAKSRIVPPWQPRQEVVAKAAPEEEHNNRPTKKEWPEAFDPPVDRSSVNDFWAKKTGKSEDEVLAEWTVYRGQLTAEQGASADAEEIASSEAVNKRWERLRREQRWEWPVIWGNVGAAFRYVFSFKDSEEA